MTNRFAELTQDIQDRIREIAYLMWESAGRQHGMAMEYWLAAEQEVLSTLQAAAHRLMPEPKTNTKPAEISVPVKVAARSAVEESPAGVIAPAPAAIEPAAAKPAVRRTSRAKAKV